MSAPLSDRLLRRNATAFIQASQLVQRLKSGTEQHIDAVRRYHFDGGAKVARPELLYPNRIAGGYSIGCEPRGDSSWEIVEELSKHTHTGLFFQAGFDQAFEGARIATEYAPVVQRPLDSTPKMRPPRELKKVRLVFVPNRSKELAAHPFRRRAGRSRTLEPTKKNLVNVNELVFDDRLHFDTRAIWTRCGKQHQWRPMPAIGLNCGALASGHRLHHPAARHVTNQIGPAKQRRCPQPWSDDLCDSVPETYKAGTSLMGSDERQGRKMV